MAIQKLHIEAFLEKSEGYPVLDVRSPKEYEHAHIPGAFSLPIFNDEERAVIGTAYKQQGREKAVQEGLAFFSSRMRDIQPAALKVASTLANRHAGTFFVHCWRGGMRSGAISWLLSLYGYKVYVLEGGYKSFRRWVLNQFDKPYGFKVLGGFTGSGKTEVLKQLSALGHPVIDLEGLANHKGSAFGSLGMPDQPSQEMFENRLAVALYKSRTNGRPVWIEDESRHIGRVHIPKPLWETMRGSPLYFLDIPVEKRLQCIVGQYGCFEKELLVRSILKIEKRLGRLDAKNAIGYVEAGDLSSAFAILLRYYDKMYGHSLQVHAESGVELHKISTLDVDKKNAALLAETSQNL